MSKLFGILLIAATLTVPFVTANHGLAGEIVATLDDGSIAVANIAYITGNGNTQTFSFAWTTSAGATLNCNGFGSIEVGFVGVGCDFSTGPSGDSHTYPYGNVDHHEVAVSLNGVSGTGQQIFCPDSGQLSLGCQTAVGAL